MPDVVTLAAIRTIVREELAAALRPPPRRPLAPADRAWLTLLLPAVTAAAGDAILTTAELAGLALRPANAGLATALARHATSLKSLGKALSRGSGHVVGGFELRNVGGSRDGALWQVVRV